MCLLGVAFVMGLFAVSFSLPGAYCCGEMGIHTVDRCYLFCFVNRDPIFDWCVVQRGSKGKHQEATCLKEIGLCSPILITTLHSTMNMTRRTYVSIYEINQHNII